MVVGVVGEGKVADSWSFFVFFYSSTLRDKIPHLADIVTT